MSIQDQIQQTKQEKKEYLQELYFVDYCNNCKTGLAAAHDVPCHHPFYCWHEDNTGDLQAEIVALQNKEKLTTQEYHRLKELKIQQRKMVIKGLREWRKKNF